jgi:hypothetical protein
MAQATVPVLYFTDSALTEDRGSLAAPPVAHVRIRRFGGLSGHLFPREGMAPGFGSVHPPLMAPLTKN